MNWQRNRRKHLFGNTLEELLAAIDRLRPDHLALTGDIVNLAADLEISGAAAWLQGFADPQSVSVVPGNHDAYVPGALRKIMRAWHPWIQGDDHQPEWRSPEQVFPYLRIRQNIALIGVSTATASPPFMATGYFGARQSRRLTEMLQRTGAMGLFRVIMIHHPPIRGATPNYKRMIGIGRFAKAVQSGGAELVVHGHTHLNSLYWLEGRDGPVPVVGIASASQSHGGTKPPSGFNLFSISGQKGAWHLLRERYALAADGKTFELAQTDTLTGEATLTRVVAVNPASA